MARSLSAAVHDESTEIIRWYRDLLDNTPPPAGLEWEPVRIGPTWQWSNGWVLPEASMAWEMFAFCGQWMRGKNGPWQFTAEQARFLLWFYALESDGSWSSASAVLQRLKGWGKDPIAATIGGAGMCADLTFDHWVGDRPVGRPDEDAWIQLVAVSQVQTQNTMKLFPGLFSAEARARFGIQVGKLNVWAMGDSRQIEAVTASPLSLEGGRPTLVVRNETQNWNGSNDGHEMAGVIEGNVAKSPRGAARILDICNAYRPGEDSVGQRVREAWEATQGDEATARDFGLLYDSLEAPPEAPLTADAAPSVVEAIRGDSVWLDIKRIVKSIVNPSNPPSESRRKWYNQITAAEDSWTTPQLWDQCIARDARVDLAVDEWALFLDCSKSDDATALVGCRISDGYRVTLGMWARPAGERGRLWTVPRDRVDARVREVKATHRVVAFFGDPSHVLDDESRDRYWDALFDEWHREFKDSLKVWAKPGAQQGHSIMWDMADSQRVREFTQACEQTLQEIEEGALQHDGDARLRRHVLNARRAPNRFGVSIAKRHRESPDKIDLAVCMVGAGMVRRLYLNSKKNERERTGVAYFRPRF